jgi:hypothetical protein
MEFTGKQGRSAYASLRRLFARDAALSGPSQPIVYEPRPADFQDAKRDGTDFTGARADQSTRWPAKFVPARRGVRVK